MADPAAPLTRAQRALLSQKLLDLRDVLRGAITVGRESAKPVELDQSSVGRVSRIDAIQVQQMAKANLESQKQRLQQVTQALTRIERDTYGDCLRCEEPIAFARLEVKPETPLCRDCQSAREGSR